MNENRRPTINRKVQRILTTTAIMIGTLVLLTATPAAAQDDPAPVYTRVAMWQVDRAQWGDFVEDFEMHDQPVLEKLFNEGVIIEWGLDAMSLHHPEGYTHGTWWSATSMVSLEKVLTAFDEAAEKRGKDAQKKIDAHFAGMLTKHRDYMLRSGTYRAKDAKLDDGYFVSSSVRVKSGRDDDYHSFWDNRVKPVYEKLLQEGTIVAFGLTVEEISTGKPGGHESWYFTANAEGIDKVKAAFRADWGEEDKEGRRARWASIKDVVEEGTHREQMTNLIHYATRAY